MSTEEQKTATAQPGSGTAESGSGTVGPVGKVWLRRRYESLVAGRAPEGEEFGGVVVPEGVESGRAKVRPDGHVGDREDGLLRLPRRYAEGEVGVASDGQGIQYFDLDSRLVLARDGVVPGTRYAPPPTEGRVRRKIAPGQRVAKPVGAKSRQLWWASTRFDLPGDLYRGEGYVSRGDKGWFVITHLGTSELIASGYEAGRLKGKWLEIGDRAEPNPDPSAGEGDPKTLEDDKRSRVSSMKVFKRGINYPTGLPDLKQVIFRLNRELGEDRPDRPEHLQVLWTTMWCASIRSRIKPPDFSVHDPFELPVSVGGTIAHPGGVKFRIYVGDHLVDESVTLSTHKVLVATAAGGQVEQHRVSVTTKDGRVPVDRLWQSLLDNTAPGEGETAPQVSEGVAAAAKREAAKQAVAEQAVAAAAAEEAAAVVAVGEEVVELGVETVGADGYITAAGGRLQAGTGYAEKKVGTWRDEGGGVVYFDLDSRVVITREGSGSEVVYAPEPTTMKGRGTGKGEGKGAGPTGKPKGKGKGAGPTGKPKGKGKGAGPTGKPKGEGKGRGVKAKGKGRGGEAKGKGRGGEATGVVVDLITSGGSGGGLLLGGFGVEWVRGVDGAIVTDDMWRSGLPADLRRGEAARTRNLCLVDSLAQLLSTHDVASRPERLKDFLLANLPADSEQRGWLEKKGTSDVFNRETSILLQGALGFRLQVFVVEGRRVQARELSVATEMGDNADPPLPVLFMVHQGGNHFDPLWQVAPVAAEAPEQGRFGGWSGEAIEVSEGEGDVAVVQRLAGWVAPDRRLAVVRDQARVVRAWLRPDADGRRWVVVSRGEAPPPEGGGGRGERRRVGRGCRGGCGAVGPEAGGGRVGVGWGGWRAGSAGWGCGFAEGGCARIGWWAAGGVGWCGWGVCGVGWFRSGVAG